MHACTSNKIKANLAHTDDIVNFDSAPTFSPKIQYYSLLLVWFVCSSLIGEVFVASSRLDVEVESSRFAFATKFVRFVIEA